MKQTYVGKASFSFETGMEGIVWVFQPDNVVSLKDIGWINAANLLTATAPQGVALFDDVAEKDAEVGKAFREVNSHRIQHRALGCWIHWSQFGLT